MEIESSQLIENKNFLEGVLDISPNTIYVYDLPQKDIIYVNKNSITSIGYTPEAIVHSGEDFFFELIHPEDLFKMIKHHKEIIDIKDGEIRNVEVRFRHAEGNWIWFNLRESVLKRNKKGEVQQVVGNAVDITEKKKKDTEIEENRCFINSVMNATPGNIFLFDPIEYKVLFDSMNALETLGYAPEDLIELGNQFFPQLLHPKDTEIAKSTIEKLKESKTDQNQSYQARYRHVDGSWRWFNLTLRPFKRNDQGILKEVVGVAIDITPQKEAEIKLKENEHFIKEIADAVPHFILVHDLINNKNVFSNHELEIAAGFGIPIKDNIYSRIHPDDLPAFLENEKKIRASADNEVWESEARIRNADGTYRWENMRAKVFKRNERGEVWQIVISAIDITARKNAEEELKQSKLFIEKIIDTIPSIYVMDLVNMRVIYLNKSVFDPVGYSFQEVASWGVDVFTKSVHPEDLPKLMDHLEKIRQSKEDQIYTMETRVIDSKGQWHWFLTREGVFQRDKQGNVTHSVGVATDITDRKKAEEELKESKLFIEKITETTPNIIYVFDLEYMKNIYINRTSIEMLGYSPVEVQQMGEQFTALKIHPDDIPGAIQRWQQYKEGLGNQIKNYEFRIKDSAGEWHWFLARDAVFRKNAQGKASQIVGVATDITERKKAEEELKANKLFIEKITETTVNIIYVFDIASMKTTYINAASIEILGYLPEEIKRMGDNVLPQLMHPEDLPGVMDHFEKIRKSLKDEISTIEYRMKDSKGQWHWFISKDVVFQRDDYNNVVQIAGVAADITEIKKLEVELRNLNNKLEEKVEERTKELQESEENLRQRESQLRLITNSIPALISYIDNKEIYRFANPFYQNILNASSEVTGKQIKDVIGSEAYNVSKDNFHKALRGETVSFENKIFMKDGSVKTIKVNYMPDKDEKKRTRGIVVMGIDLTDRIEYEQSLQNKNIELKRINADLDNFIYTASHDLKTPIANLEGLLNAINGDIKEKCGEDIAGMFDMMNISIKRLRTTISELTEISKIQKNQDGNMELLYFNEFIEEFKREFSVQIKNSNAEIITQFKVDNILFLRKNFRSIIYNLLDNAIKYRSPDRPLKIIVKTEMIKEDCTLMTIKDNGIGFDISKKDKVFGLFKRVHIHKEGTGIGLYIVKKIMENSGGKVDVESEVNKGSVFKIYFKTE